MAIAAVASFGVAVQRGIEAFAVFLQALTLFAVTPLGFRGRLHLGDAVERSCPGSDRGRSHGTSLLGTKCVGIALQRRNDDLGPFANTCDAVLVVVTLDAAAHVGALHSIGEALELRGARR